VTGRQIRWAIDHGFEDMRLDSAVWNEATLTNIDAAKVSASVIAVLKSGRSAIVHSCCGPNDPRFIATGAANRPAESHRNAIGPLLGHVLREVVRSRSVERVAVFGGDTAGCVARCLDIEALEYLGPLEPGAPLCQVHSPDTAVDGLEIVFKGGQVGYDDFVRTVLRGKPERVP
jgi:uncharacterized protein YgbK (DUF1537 family)